jgi:hypothetical protein
MGPLENATGPHKIFIQCTPHFNGGNYRSKNNMAELDLEKLSTAEIKKLWQQTTARAKRRAEQSHASPVTDVMGDGDDYYIDGFGNAIPGKRPTKKTVKTFVDSEGYIQEIGEHEKIPEKGGLISWLNNVDVANDPEVREALGEEALYFEPKSVRAMPVSSLSVRWGKAAGMSMRGASLRTEKILGSGFPKR